MKNRILAITTLSTAISFNTLAAPTITETNFEPSGISSAFNLKITGEQFGNGPNVAYFNNFDTADTTITAAPTTTSSSSTISTSSYKGKRGFKVVNESNDEYNILRISLGQQAEEVFLAYSVTIPEGNTPPNSTIQETFNGSSWKFAWLLEHDGANSVESSFDLCTPTQVGDSMYIGGNSSKYIRRSFQDTFRVAKYSDWWDWRNFNYVNYWIQKNESNNSNSNSEFSTVNSINRLSSFSMDSSVIELTGPDVSISQINIPGWTRNTPEDNFQAIYDDIYIATGKYSRARVELTDSASYDQSSIRIQAPSLSWSSNEINARLNTQDLKSINTLYLYVFNSEGQRSESIKVNICFTCPKSPPRFGALPD